MKRPTLQTRMPESKRRCVTAGCNKHPNFGVHRGKGTHCKAHATPDMVNVKSKRCAAAGCEKQPVFDMPGGKGTYCRAHATPDMVDVKSKRCAADGCESLNPVFGVHRGKPTHCRAHATPDMVDVVSKRCAAAGCHTRPSFGVPGGKATHCKAHATPNMVNVVSKRCAAAGCNKQPSFGAPGEKGTHCKAHATADMVDVKSKRCAVCNKQPTFGVPGGQSTHCKAHATADMVDVVSKQCAADGCETRPNFDMPGGKGTYCRAHATADMVDVKNNRCAGCETRATYGHPGHAASFCAQHRVSGTIFRPRRRCNVTGCKNVAIFGISVARHCEVHNNEDELNLVHFACARCGLPDLLNPDTQLCSDCGNTSYRHGRKERVILHLFERNGITGYVHDRAATTCGKERPDFRFDDPTHVTVVEVDEFQHASYECERVRMINLCQASWKPHVFIRYNPDPFTTAGRALDPPDEHRHRKLLEVLHLARALPPIDTPNLTLRVTHLFYDGHVRGPPIFDPIFVQ